MCDLLLASNRIKNVCAGESLEVILQFRAKIMLYLEV